MEGFTENGAPSFESTLDPRLNLFFKTVRNLGEPQHRDRLEDLIFESWMTDQLDTMKILMNWRDCRGGKGDHAGFVSAMAILADFYKDSVKCNLHLIPEYGSWLDLMKLWHKSLDVREDIMEIVVDQLNKDMEDLKEGNTVSLLGKWLPSENAKWDRFSSQGKKREDRFCLALCRRLFGCEKGKVGNYHLKKLRTEYIVPLRKQIDIVESKMCANKYGTIDYEKVPSLAMTRYRDAFLKNDGDRFSEYLYKVVNKEAKINSSQVYPHDLVKHYLHSCTAQDDPVIEAQWAEIKAKVAETGAFKDAIAIVDVSGSMSGEPMCVAIALGLLSCGPWNDHSVISFSETPILHKIKEGSLREQVNQIKRIDWGQNTNIQAALDLAKDNKRLFIFSDMQFDQVYQHDENKQVILWNLRGDTDDFPVTCDAKGAIMLSGFSPSLLAVILDNDELTPLTMMFKVIRSERYAKVTI